MALSRVDPNDTSLPLSMREDRSFRGWNEEPKRRGGPREPKRPFRKMGWNDGQRVVLDAEYDIWNVYFHQNQKPTFQMSMSVWFATQDQAGPVETKFLDGYSKQQIDRFYRKMAERNRTYSEPNIKRFHVTRAVLILRNRLKWMYKLSPQEYMQLLEVLLMELFGPEKAKHQAKPNTKKLAPKVWQLPPAV